MENSKLVKVVLVMIISFIMILGVRTVFAADIDITPTNNIINNTTNSVVNNTVNKTTNNTSTNNVLRTNNTTTNSSSLPKTGIEDSLPITVLVLVLGISAVFASKKIQYYKNI